MYSRQINGRTLTLAASGWTYRRTFVLYDRETRTLWYPLPGTSGLTGIAGPLADEVLPELPSARKRWKEWQRENPESKHMRYRRSY